MKTRLQCLAAYYYSSYLNLSSSLTILPNIPLDKFKYRVVLLLLQKYAVGTPKNRACEAVLKTYSTYV